MWIDTLGGLRERESRPCGGLNHLCVAFLPGFLWPVILLCLVLSPYLVYLRVLPCVRTYALKLPSSVSWLLVWTRSAEEAWMLVCVITRL